MKATLAESKVRVVPVLFSNLGSLHVRDLQRLEGHLYAAFDAEELLVVDCRAVQSLGAGFVGVLARLAAQARWLGSEVVLADVSENCREVLVRCGLSHLCTTI